MCVLFTSVRPLYRAENLKAVYDAYDGEKQYVQRYDGKPIEGMNSGRYRLVVTDGLIDESPGKYLWIGHGMGAGKTVGMHHPHWKFKGSSLITYAIASSPEMVPVVASFCGISQSQVIPLGMPRTDAYFRMMPKLHKGVEHLYVPTFRRGDWPPDFNLLWRTLPEDHRLIYKPHMVTGNTVTTRYPNIEVASAWEPSTSYLVNADTVITDYSSIMFDAMVLRRPVILFAKDCRFYLRDRGMYYPYPSDYSEYYAETEAELVELLEEAVWSDYLEDRRSFYAGACDGNSTQRVIDLIRTMI